MPGNVHKKTSQRVIEKSAAAKMDASDQANSLPRLRARLWIEIGGGSALTDAGADLLSQIDACGSLSEAARRLGFSYRRAWLLANQMNTRWPEPLLATATGGTRGGGSKLTEQGHRVLRSFRDIQIQLDHQLDLLRLEIPQ